jgi:hypothetical protein
LSPPRWLEGVETMSPLRRWTGVLVRDVVLVSPER